MKDASDMERAEKDMLGGRDGYAVEDLWLGEEDEDSSGTEGRGLVVMSSGGAARNADIVRVRRRMGFSSGVVVSKGFFSGSLYSSLPLMSDAKYSSPRPKTTWRDGKSRVVLSSGHNHCWSAGGRS